MHGSNDLEIKRPVCSFLSGETITPGYRSFMMINSSVMSVIPADPLESGLCCGTPLGSSKQFGNHWSK